MASLGSAALGLVVIAVAIASLASGHGQFSGAIGIWLLLYGLVGVASAVALWRRSLLGRGPALVEAALNLIVGFTMAPAAPAAWLVVALAAVTVVATVLPSTTAALHWPTRRRAQGPVRRSGEPPATERPGS